MVLHFIIEKEHLCTKETLINRIQTAAKAQCTSKIKGALSLDIRSFYNMPIDLANSQDTRTSAEKGLIRPVHISILQPNLQYIQEALHAFTDDASLQIVELRVSQFYSMRPRMEIILNTMGDDMRSSPSNKETSI